MYYSIPNLSAVSTVPIEKPWEVRPPELPAFADKAEFRQWQLQLTTQHYFISGIEGLAPGARVAEDNQPLKMWHLVVDYDGVFKEERCKELLENPASEFLPAWYIRTSGGGARLVWDFEGPALLGSADHGQKFLALLVKKLGLKKWLPGFDANAMKVTQYFEIGVTWTKMTECKIPKNIIDLWILDSTEKAVMVRGELPEIPLDVVKAEVDRRFPGRWTGAFEYKSMGVRFWDPAADNPRGASVLKTGMMAFSGEQAFLSWRQLFGVKFVEAFVASKVEGLVDSWVFDGQCYWRRNPEARWYNMDKGSANMQLKDVGVSSRPGSYNACTSEVEHFLVMVQNSRRVERALPFVHRPGGLIQHPVDGKIYLNTATTKCVHPAPPMTDGKMRYVDLKKFCPQIYRLLNSMFGAADTEDAMMTKTGVDQLLHFMSWLKYFYMGCYLQEPKPGHAMVLTGPVGKGKTLFMNKVVGTLVGGHADASSHLIGQEQWTSHLLNSALWMVDDSSAAADHSSHMKYTSKLKSYVANAMVHFNQKFMQTGFLPFEARICIITNSDAESMRVMPSIDMSNRDKISLFKASSYLMKFPSRDDMASALQSELPFFARFLVDWEYPDGMFDDTWRFGVEAYHHPDLVSESRRQGKPGAFLDVLGPYMDSFHEQFKDDTMVMAASQIFKALSEYNSVCMREFTVHSVGLCLGVLSKQGYPIQPTTDRSANRATWTVRWPLVPTNDVTPVPDGHAVVDGGKPV